VFVLDQTHSKTHRLSHRLIPVRQDEAIELMDYSQEIRVFWMSGAPDTIRTCGLRLRRATLYPAELRVRSDYADFAYRV
jgi:hypothetical protein